MSRSTSRSTEGHETPHSADSRSAVLPHAEQLTLQRWRKNGLHCRTHTHHLSHAASFTRQFVTHIQLHTYIRSYIHTYIHTYSHPFKKGHVLFLKSQKKQKKQKKHHQLAKPMVKSLSSGSFNCKNVEATRHKQNPTLNKL